MQSGSLSGAVQNNAIGQLLKTRLDLRKPRTVQEAQPQTELFGYDSTRAGGGANGGATFGVLEPPPPPDRVLLSSAQDVALVIKKRWCDKIFDGGKARANRPDQIGPGSRDWMLLSRFPGCRLLLI